MPRSTVPKEGPDALRLHHGTALRKHPAGGRGAWPAHGREGGAFRTAAAFRVAAAAGMLALLAWGLAACGSRAAQPAAGESVGALPDLTGRTVMVLPVQSRAGLEGMAGDPDAELAFALQSRDAGVDWVTPDGLRTAVESSPSLAVRLDALPVGVFLRTEVERVGDPLYGILRRLGALTGAEAALIPVQLRYRPGSPAGAGAVEVVAALLDVRTGWVLWFGVEDGEPGGPGEPAALASALEALARRVSPRGR